MAALSPALGFAAGALTILSPCVLPLVPIVLGAAAQRHRLGPLALAGGLVLSFTAVGFTLAAAGDAIGLDSGALQIVGAVLMVAAGTALLIPAAGHAFERALVPVAGWAGRRQQGAERFGLAGQAAIGALLGLVWSPCVGPTLGAATAVAAQGRDLGEVAVVMGAFGLGIASVLLVLATATRSLVARSRGSLLGASAAAKKALGALMLVVGLAILTGADKALETVLVEHSPNWLSELSTRY